MNNFQTEHLQIVRSIIQVFQELTGSVADERRETEILIPWIQLGWQIYDFRLVIEHHLNDPVERKFLESPGRMNLRSIFNPNRRDRLLDVHSDLKRAKEIQKRVDQNSSTPDLKINKIILSCCGILFEQKFAKVLDPNVKPGGFRWKNISLEAFEKHFHECIAKGASHAGHRA